MSSVSPVVRGFQHAGNSEAAFGAQYAGGSLSVQGGQYAGAHTEQPDMRGITARGAAYAGGSTPSFQWGGPAADSWGGQYDGPADDSIADLIDTSGFALVLENPSGTERLAFSPEQPTYQDIKTAEWTNEVNKMASWAARGADES